MYYRKTKDGKGAAEETWRVVIRTLEEKERIMESCHAGVGGIFNSIHY